MSLTQSQQKDQEPTGHSPLLHWVLVEGRGPLSGLGQFCRAGPDSVTATDIWLDFVLSSRTWGSDLAWQRGLQESGND
jgi:hypothetical protein